MYLAQYTVFCRWYLPSSPTRNYWVRINWQLMLLQWEIRFQVIQSIYIKRYVSACVGGWVSNVLFVPGGQTICLSPRGQTFLTHRRGGDKHFSHTGEGGGQTFLTHRKEGGTNISHKQGWWLWWCWLGDGCEWSKHFCERSEQALRRS